MGCLFAHVYISLGRLYSLRCSDDLFFQLQAKAWNVITLWLPIVHSAQLFGVEEIRSQRYCGPECARQLTNVHQGKVSLEIFMVSAADLFYLEFRCLIELPFCVFLVLLNFRF